MQAFMEERPEKDFINMNNIKYIMLILGCFACRKNGSDSNPDPIREVPVNITINMALPAYFHLQNTGTYVFENGGVKGVVLIHHPDDNFYAFDRACSYQPSTSGCSRLEIDTPYMQLRCGETTKSGFQKCCDSRFFFDGSVAQGPARYSLKSYRVTKSGNIITISN